jgi:hypothetical protein
MLKPGFRENTMNPWMEGLKSVDIIIKNLTEKPFNN